MLNCLIGSQHGGYGVVKERVEILPLEYTFSSGKILPDLDNAITAMLHTTRTRPAVGFSAETFAFFCQKHRASRPRRVPHPRRLIKAAARR